MTKGGTVGFVIVDAVPFIRALAFDCSLVFPLPQAGWEA